MILELLFTMFSSFKPMVFLSDRLFYDRVFHELTFALAKRVVLYKAGFILV